MTCPYCSAEVETQANHCAHCGRDPTLLKPVCDRIALLETQIAAIKTTVDKLHGRQFDKAANWRYLVVLALVPAIVSYILVKGWAWAGYQSTSIALALTYVGVIVVGFALGRREVQLTLWIFLVVVLSSLAHFSAVSYAEYVGGSFFLPYYSANMKTLAAGAIILTFALLIGRAGRFFTALSANEQFVIAVEFCIIILTLAELSDNLIRAEAWTPGGG